jgi:hypothetical protein
MLTLQPTGSFAGLHTRGGQGGKDHQRGKSPGKTARDPVRSLFQSGELGRNEAREQKAQLPKLGEDLAKS